MIDIHFVVTETSASSFLYRKMPAPGPQDLAHCCSTVECVYVATTNDGKETTAVTPLHWISGTHHIGTINIVPNIRRIDFGFIVGLKDIQRSSIRTPIVSHTWELPTLPQQQKQEEIENIQTNKLNTIDSTTSKEQNDIISSIQRASYDTIVITTTTLQNTLWCDIYTRTIDTEIYSTLERISAPLFSGQSITNVHPSIEPSIFTSIR